MQTNFTAGYLWRAGAVQSGGWTKAPELVGGVTDIELIPESENTLRVRARSDGPAPSANDLYFLRIIVYGGVLKTCPLMLTQRDLGLRGPCRLEFTAMPGVSEAFWVIETTDIPESRPPALGPGVNRGYGSDWVSSGQIIYYPVSGAIYRYEENTNNARTADNAVIGELFLWGGSRLDFVTGSMEWGRMNVRPRSSPPKEVLDSFLGKRMTFRGKVGGRDSALVVKLRNHSRRSFNAVYAVSSGELGGFGDGPVLLVLDEVVDETPPGEALVQEVKEAPPIRQIIID